jgi:iron complex transport system ATP-binding protein
MLEMINGGFGYHRDPMVFQNLNFKINNGEIMSILGPNGCGKTTLLKCLMGIMELTQGSVLMDGHEVPKAPDRSAGQNIGYVPQNHNMVYSYTVLEMTLMGRARFIPIFSVPSSEDVKIARASLKMAEIGGYEDRIFSELSGGEKQLVLIARALASDAEILIFDEPTSALDYKNQYMVIKLLYKLAKERDHIIIMTTHHPEHALNLSDKILLMNGSKYCQFGDTSSIFTKENINKLYGIDVEIVSVLNGENRYKGLVPLIRL